MAVNYLKLGSFKVYRLNELNVVIEKEKVV